MTKFEWDRRFKQALSALPDLEKRRVLEYYDELFEDKIDSGMKEEKIIQKFGEPEDAAKKILADYEDYLKRSEAEGERDFDTVRDETVERDSDSEDTCDEEGEESDEDEDEDEDDTDKPAGGFWKGLKHGFKHIGKKIEKAFSGAVSSTKEAGRAVKKDIERSFAPDDESRLTGRIELGEADGESGVRKLDLHLKLTDVTIRYGERFLVRYEADSNVEYETSVQDGVFTAREKSVRIFGFFGFASPQMIIELPRLDEVRLEADGGDCRIGEFEINRVEIDNATGDSLLSCDCETVKISTRSGDIKLSGEYGSVEAKATSGDISFKNGNVQELTVETTSGDIGLLKATVFGLLTARSGSGSIDIDRSVIYEADITSNSGDVSLDLADGVENYHAEITTRSGDVDSSASSSGGKRLKIRTTSGDIEIA